MYLINTELTINWLFPASTIPINRTGLDVKIKPPKELGSVSVITDAIQASDYLVNSLTSNGYAAYRFTPDKLGLWVFVLSNDSGNADSVYLEHKIIVSINDTTISKLVNMDNF